MVLFIKHNWLMLLLPNSKEKSVEHLLPNAPSALDVMLWVSPKTLKLVHNPKNILKNVFNIFRTMKD